MTLTSPAASPSASLDASYGACREITRRHARSFYLASHTLPKGKRREAWAVYAFCRVADDAVDLATDDASRRAALAAQERGLDRLFDPRIEAAALPSWGPAFRDTCERRGIPRGYFDGLLKGISLDCGAVRIGSWAELDLYCHHVASLCGLVMTRIFVADPDAELLDHAAALGTAMQLTNILRDVGEDWERDRIYLPSYDLAKFGLGEGDIAAFHKDKATKNKAGKTDDRFRALMRFEIERAREWYQKADPGIARLPNDGTRRTVWTMRLLYAAILDEIERNDFDVFTRRARVGRWRKASLLVEAWLRSHRPPPTPTPEPR
ncbi:phytoene synthase [Verrucomicrobium sp. GAS474]|uniref:phytoene/squalene synthase family protein n=1 Tax=Verrucomicrobium sp. GAS474 TaxID=1882831 RepID=UPI00087CA2EF|nr:phytoene/squalene synthase family protein [Verrucomicrobium sp. GAS474]SDT98172.1 phytoene synthase [Verrucomicrobium sp. GAS474]